jgi:hypothetical protein
MTLIRIVVNAVIMLSELAAVIAVAWLGFSAPIQFTVLTALLALGLGLLMEAERLRIEFPFYFERTTAPRAWLVMLVGGLEAILKAILAGVAALFTFSGTNPDRLFWVAVVFGVTVFMGANVLRVLSRQLKARPARWGFFRLGAPLGLLFSAGLAGLAAIALIPSSSISDLGWRIMWDMPPKPSVNEVSELVFQLKQAFDNFVVAVLSRLVSVDLARFLGIFVSVNVLAGFVAAIYAAVIASGVRRAEILLLPEASQLREVAER